MPRKVTTEEFIERAKAVHGDTYDYSESVYAGTHKKLRIICPEHGVFEQSPANHLKGKGCPECGKVKAGNARRSGLDEFIAKARKVHGDFYDYSQVEYKTSATPVTIICPEHGPFQQTPNGHLSGRGCRKCAGNMPYTTESFIEAAREVHGDEFDYSKVDYKGVHDKVCITCSVHGEFWQEPIYHLKGGGCPTCSKIRGHKLHRDHVAEVKKREATMMERYGVAHALESNEFMQKAKNTWEERYGVDHPMKSDEVMQGYRDTMQERYGVDYAYQSEEIYNKARETWMENYGTDSPLASDAVRAKSKETWMEKYGVDNPMKADEVREKAIETLLREYGVDNVMKSDEVKEKAAATCMERYGADSPLGSDVIRAKSKETWMEKYGVDCPFKAEEVKAKSVETWLEKYGVDSPTKSPIVLEKIHQTKREHGTFNTSEPEERLYAMLVNVFGEDDVERQFSKDERYPFACDFYVKSLDLFIELNASWTHGGKWYDAEDEMCLDKLQKWTLRSLNSDYYRAAITTWTGSDVRKRLKAQEKNLNYVVFWDNDLSDAVAWVDEGCPLRTDWQ